jgi:hypothetical protein
MNERIKELADLCTTKTRFSYEGTGGGYDTEHFNKEKFAELIVKKCALQCVHNEDMDLIEKYFGVEE